MVRHAVGYRARAYVTFGPPIPLAGYDPDSRRDLVTLTHRVHDEIGRLYKVQATALVAAAMRPHTSRADLVARVGDLVSMLSAEGANLAVETGRQAVEEGLARLVARGVVVDGARVRDRDRVVLRYYARTIEHVLHRPRTTH